MKKLLSVLSIVLVITVAKAQQATDASNQAPATNSTIIISGKDKQCQSAGKDCPAASSEKKSKNKSKTCTANSQSSATPSDSSTESMSAEHVGTGSVIVIPTSTSDKKCSSNGGKSCCKGVSKASALNSSLQTQPSKEAVPK